MDPSNQDRWSEWSPWHWDPAQNLHWRARQDPQGRYHYDYSYPNTATSYPNTATQTAPRGSDVNELATTFSNVHIDGQDVSYNPGGAYTHQPGVLEATNPGYGSHFQSQGFPPKGKERVADQPPRPRNRGYRETPKDRGYSSKKHRSRGARNAADADAEGAANDTNPYDPFYQKPGAAPDTGYTPASDNAYVDSQTAYSGQRYGVPSREDAYGSGRQENSAGGDGFYTQEESAQHEVEEPPSEHGHYAQHTHAPDDGSGLAGSIPEEPPAEEHASAYPPPEFDGSEVPVDPEPPNELLQAMSQADPYLTGAPFPEGDASPLSPPHGHAYAGYEEEGGHGTQTQLQAGMAEVYPPPDNHPARLSSTREFELHDGYAVQHSSMFRPGEVFKILWCEPLGAGAHKSEVITNFFGLQEQNGKQFYQGIRRFIVVANDEGHCTCVPILTYEHKACTKKGVKPSKHGIVYQLGKKPRMVENEPKLGFEPVRLELYERTEKLDKESRVNYAKLTTVEHNFKVFFIGRIVPQDFNRIVSPAVEECWSRKRRHNH